MSAALRRIENGSNYFANRIDDPESFQDSTIRIKQVVQRGLESNRQFSLRAIPTFACDLMHSCFCRTWDLIKNNSISNRISNDIIWMTARTKEAASKANELPYFISHPRLIINICYNQRVKYAMTNLEPVQIKTTLSQILPAHSIEGNLPAVKKNKERVLALKKYKHQFNTLFIHHRPITEQLIESIMQSTSPMQLAFHNKSGKCIAFGGNSRLIALKIFCSEEFPNHDPEIETNIYYVDQRLINNAIYSS